MNRPLLPLGGSLALHALVALALLWQSSDRPAPRVVQPPAIQARAVTMEQMVPTRQVAAAEQQRKAAQQQREAEQRQAAERRRAEEQRRQQRAAEQRRAEQQRRRAEEERRRAEQQRRIEEQRRREAEEQRLLEQQRRLLSEQAAAEEQRQLHAEEDRALTMSHAALIERAIIAHWSRPASARNDMQAELLIHLVPTGEVVQVSVARSSGNAAFDRAAENAVRRAGRFPELQQLPSRVFEQNFRRFRLVFRPEDLRR